MNYRGNWVALALLAAHAFDIDIDCDPHLGSDYVEPSTHAWAGLMFR
jgi:hypothetical protein